MRDNKLPQEDELAEHYDFDYSQARPNRFASRFSEGVTVTVLDADESEGEIAPE